MSKPIALVTGAGTGIGKTIAAALLREGYAVAMTGRRREVLETAASEMTGDTFIHSADIGIAEEVDGLFDAVVSQYGRLDLLVNNAGMSAPAVPIDELDVALWHQVVGANLTGAFLCTRAAFRQMKRQDPQGGRIINNGSISAHSPRPRTVAYAVTKHAMTGLTKSIELDGRAFGITCGQIDIGNTATEIMDTIGVGSGALQADGTRKVEPMFPVDDAARAVLMMAGMPPSASVGSVVITAAGMPFIGRG